jgi:hypothetical protein
MSRRSVLLAALTQEPASTSELYARVGYAALTRVGLVPYDAFRAELLTLSAAGLAESDTASDGSTIWRLIAEPASGAAEPPAG